MSVALLEARIHAASERFRELVGAWPGGWERMVGHHGSVLAACRAILDDPRYEEKLWETWISMREHVFTDSIEAIVQQDQFRALFTPAQLAEANRRLTRLRENRTP